MIRLAPALNTNMKIIANLSIVIASIVVITAVLLFPNNDYRWINHAIIGLTAASFFAATAIRGAILSGRIHRPLNRGVFRLHRKFGVIMGSLILATFVYGIWMVMAREYPLMTSTHGLMGLLIVIISLVQIFVGFYFKRRGMVSSVHRWTGYSLAGLIVFQIVLGVLLSPMVAGESPRYRVRLSTPPAEETWQPDGIISPGEYFFTRVLDDGNYEISYRTDERHIYIGLKVKTTGWVGVGIQPDRDKQMLAADIVFSYITADTVMVSDHFGTGSDSHLPDTELGGTDDILESGGKEEEGCTVIEFKRALITEDKYDIPLVESVQTIIWAYGLYDNEEKHIAAGFIEINIVPR